MTSDVDAAPPSQTEASRVSPPVAASGEAPIQEAQATEASHEAGGAEEQKTRIKIGTQRPGVAVPRIQPRAKVAFRTPAVSSPHVESPSAEPQAEKPAHSGPPSEGEAKAKPPVLPREGGSQFIKPGAKRSKFEVSAPPMAKVERPNIRADLSPELEAELQAALGEQSLEELIGADSPEATSGQTAGELLEVESRHKGTIVRIFRDNVFVDLGGRNQGALILHTLPQEPQPGDVMDVVVTKFNADDGLYELTAVGASVDIGDWSDISEGITVDARITGHNKGGLECEVNKIRGFIPAGQISIYRVENFEEFVGQNWACIVVEANRDRRNLVLSRRGVLEREQAEAKEKLLAELAVGQEREGVVRNIRDFGAFVDLGGIDGMIHVSQMSWDRVKHPSEVLTLGQKVKVKIQKIDPETHKISLAYRDLFESPWVNATSKYPVTSKVTGTVSKIMDFGAFVKLEPGIEGLVHISELSFKRVHRVSDIVQEGQQIEAKVLSIDPENQRISLSMKAFEARPEPTKSESNAASEAPAAEAERAPPTKKKKEPPLRGGLGRSPLAEKFGLKW